MWAAEEALGKHKFGLDAPVKTPLLLIDPHQKRLIYFYFL
jgi:hypothetical protein